MDQQKIEAAVYETGRMLRADGGNLVLVEADPKTDRIRLRLEFDDVRCEECILPPDALHATIEHALQREVGGEFELIVEDPRRGVAPN